MKRPLLGICLAFSLGILGEELLNIPVFYNFLFALTFLFGAILSLKSKKRFLLFTLSGFLCLGAAFYKYSTLLPKDHIKNIPSLNQGLPKHVFVQGQIINKPIQGLTYFNQEKTECLLNVKTIKIDSEWRTASGLLLTRVMNPSAAFKYGSDVVLEGTISIPPPATNPGQFDYKKFLARKKQFFILNIKESDFSKIAGVGRINPLKAFAYTLSNHIEGLIDKYIPPKEGSVLKALLLGERQDIDDEINDNFVKTGTVHILSISGLHVGLLAALFMLLFKLARLPFRFSAPALAFLLILYCAMVDNRPPVVRSTIMIMVFLFGKVLRRQQDLLNSLAFSALVILFFNPQDLFDISFQLSFLTMGAIIYLPPKLEPLTPRRCKHLRGVNYILHATIISFSAWLGSAPFIARYFNIVSPITLLANIFAVPWIFFVLASSMTFIIFGFLSPLLGLIFSEVSSFSIFCLTKMVSIFSNIPFGYFRVKSPPWIFIIGNYAFLFLFFNRRHIRVRAKYFFIAALIVLNGLIWHGAFSKRAGVLQISFLDVGKGDSMFLEFPKGGTMLIDGGEGRGVDMGRLVVGRFLGYKGINKIDVVVATHPHTDHIGGLAAILKNFKVRYFIDNGDREANHLWFECQRLIKEKKIKRFTVKEGDSIKGFEGVDLLVLSPPARKFNDLNNNSLVLKAGYKDFSSLFCADIEEEAVKYLLSAHGKDLESTVLKVPHHGGGLGPAVFEFVETVNPKIAVISVGGREVDEALLSALDRTRALIYRTDKNGAQFLTNENEKDK